MSESAERHVTTRIHVGLLAIAFAVVPSLLVGATSPKQGVVGGFCCEEAGEECVFGPRRCATFEVGEQIVFCYQGTTADCEQ